MNIASTPKKPPPPVNSISFCPASHAAQSFEAGIGLRVFAREDPYHALLRTTAPEQHLLCSELLHTSLPKDPGAIRNVLPQRNGFVHTVIEAYNRHRALVIRPDDVWLAILTQFCFFVNGNAEALRSTFVAHQGKRKLQIVSGGNRYTMDPSYIAHQMTELMQEHIIDGSLREWIMPSFTTTTTTDRSISAIIMLAAMKKYFSLEVALLCGIPKVTLEGEKNDWEEILHRLERLKKYGIETNTWYHLLRPVISHFIAAYDNPASPENLDFWSKVAHRTGDGSGPRWLSGWITAFCVFDEKGRWCGHKFVERRNKKASDPSKLGPAQFASAYIGLENTPYLTLDGFPYPRINSDLVPNGYAYVDIKLNDNGVVLDTMFVAGLVGSQICSMENGVRNTVRPFPAWWYFVIKEEQPEATHGSIPPLPYHTIEEATGKRRSLHQDVISRVKGTWGTLRRK